MKRTAISPDEPVCCGETVAAEAVLWQWTGGNGGVWHFLTIDGAPGEAIAAHALLRRLEIGRGRGFGSVKVSAQIGASRWRTSVFPQKTGGWILPVKAAIRRAEEIGEGDVVRFALELD